MRVIGCDPSTKRCALADETGRATSVLLYSKEENGRRLALSYSQIRLFARQFADPPDCVILEQASGASRNLPLVYMVGVTQAALYAAWEAPVFLVPSGTWKKALFGAGNGSWKADRYTEWAREQGYRFNNDDEAAAICMAQAAEKLASVKPVLAK